MSDTVSLSWNNPPEQPTKGVVHKTFFSQTANSSVGYNILLPPDYESSPNRYPVIYVLHGINENENSMVQVAPKILKAMEKNTIPPVIVVFINDGTGESFFVNAPYGKVPVETVFISELIPHIDKSYKTVANRHGRAIEGFSMGGFGSLGLAMKHTELFGSVAAYATGFISLEEEDGKWVITGGTTPQPPADLRQQIAEVMFDSNPGLFAKHDPQALLVKDIEQLRTELPIRVTVGSECGTLSYHEEFHDLMLKKSYEHQYIVVPEIGHNFEELYDQVGIEGVLFHKSVNRW